MDASRVALGRDQLVGPDPTWEALPMAERQRWLDDIDDFPPPPLLLELMEHDLRLESYDPARLAEKLSGDPVLVGRVLARANSAAFSPSTPITSLRQAMVLLGFNMVRAIVLRHQVEHSALRLQGAVRDHIMALQFSTDLGAVIAYNWSQLAGAPDPSGLATCCLLGRLGSFLLARRFPKLMPEYFTAGNEVQRLNFEANEFGVTSRSLTYKVAQAWGLPASLQDALFHLWTPLFAPDDSLERCLGAAALAMSFDPPLAWVNVEYWLGQLAHRQLRANLEACGALTRLGSLIESSAYRREVASVEEVPY
jgi:HD-like signal output (HDOD) protein